MLKIYYQRIDLVDRDYLVARTTCKYKEGGKQKFVVWLICSKKCHIRLLALSLAHTHTHIDTLGLCIKFIRLCSMIIVQIVARIAVVVKPIFLYKNRERERDSAISLGDYGLGA